MHSQTTEDPQYTDHSHMHTTYVCMMRCDRRRAGAAAGLSTTAELANSWVLESILQSLRTRGFYLDHARVVVVIYRRPSDRQYIRYIPNPGPMVLTSSTAKSLFSDRSKESLPTPKQRAKYDSTLRRRKSLPLPPGVLENPSPWCPSPPASRGSVAYARLTRERNDSSEFVSLPENPPNKSPASHSYFFAG